MSIPPPIPRPAAPGAKPPAAPPPVPGRAPTAAPPPAPRAQSAGPGGEAPRRAQPRAATQGGGGAPPPSTAGLPPGMTERQCQELYKRYQHARQSVGERGDMSYDRLMRTLCDQAPKIMRDHRAAGVDFNVVIKGNKVVLKAKPIK